MTDIPFRTRVLTAFTAALEEITPANGYLSDLSDFVHTDGQPMKRVYRGRAYFGDSDPLPMVSVLEPREEGDPFTVQPVLAIADPFDWRLLVQGFVEDDKTNPTDPAYTLLSDVRRRLAVDALGDDRGHHQAGRGPRRAAAEDEEEDR